jgi:pyrimidine operon attenuation protein/uracil phosphoribosyltransferase
MQILNHHQIEQKITRLSYEIYEEYLDSKILIVAGINNRGEALANLLRTSLKKISDLEIQSAHIQLNPADPKLEEISLDFQDTALLENASIVIVDDVANTGRTLFYACHPFLPFRPKSIKIAVLVDRKHKMYPVQVDFVGLSLATTLKEEILVHFEESGNAAYLQ